MHTILYKHIRPHVHAHIRKYVTKQTQERFYHQKQKGFQFPFSGILLVKKYIIKRIFKEIKSINSKQIDSSSKVFTWS